VVKLCRFVFAGLCAASLFASSAWAADGSAVANPVIGAEAPLFTPAPELKIGGCRTRCVDSYTTSVNGGPSAWGMGSTCSAAQTDLDAHLLAQADAHCLDLGYDGACSVTTVITGLCYWQPSINGYQTSGYADHSCLSTICIDPYY
jgi:hypothetical protein